MTGVTAGRHRTTSVRSRRSVGRWLVAWLVAWLVVDAVVVVLAGATLSAMGYRMSVVRSGSMRPTLDIGALIVSRPVSPLELRKGDLVTFRGVLFGGDNVTHRVVSTVRDGNEVEVVTKGDANQVGERWRVPAHGELGLTVFHVNRVGRWLAVLASGWVRTAAIWVAAGVLLRMLLAWIWQPAARGTEERAPAS